MVKAVVKNEKDSLKNLNNFSISLNHESECESVDNQKAKDNQLSQEVELTSVNEKILKKNRLHQISEARVSIYGSGHPESIASTNMETQKGKSNKTNKLNDLNDYAYKTIPTEGNMQTQSTPDSRHKTTSQSIVRFRNSQRPQTVAGEGTIDGPIVISRPSDIQNIQIPNYKFRG